MRILITGGAGFIGRHVIDALAAAGLGEDVTVLDSFEEVVHGAQVHHHPPDTVTGFYSGHAVPVIQGDVRRLGTLETAPALLASMDVVVHLAAAVSVSSSLDHPTRFVDHNVTGTASLWEAIRRRHLEEGPEAYAHPAGPHVVNLSSMSVYGDGLEEKGVDESWPTIPLNVYALSKLHAEQLCTLCGKLYGVPVTNLRLFNAFGPGQSLHNAETGVVAIWTALLQRGQLPVVYEDGHQLRDFIYVTDVAQAVLLAVQNQPRGIINVGSGVPTAVGHVADQLADLLGHPRVTPTGTKRSGDSRHCWGDISRARKVMNFAPTVTLLEGLHQTVAWAQQVTQVTD